MSQFFHLFPPGNPPADTDKFILTRADIASPTGFSNYLLTWAEIKAAIGVTPSGSSSQPIPGMDGEEGESPMMIPGGKGEQGTPGQITTVNIPVLISIDGEDGESPLPIPGERGLSGINGIIGRDGIPLQGLDGDEGEMGFPIPGEKGIKGDTGAGGSDPVIGSYAPGSFTILNREYVVMGHELELSGTEEVIIEGDGSLVIVG